MYEKNLCLCPGREWKGSKAELRYSVDCSIDNLFIDPELCRVLSNFSERGLRQFWLEIFSSASIQNAIREQAVYLLQISNKM